MATTLTSPAPNPTDSVARGILAASSALGIATAVERGLGFAANFLAARLGGAAVFGGYSLALTTANNIASSAGGGIGSTATRFSGEYNEGNNGYALVARALAFVSVVSALLATTILIAGAGPLARYLLHSPQLTNLLRWSALSAGAMVLLECCRGFLIGQRHYATLLLLCGLMGAGLLCGLPLAAQRGPVAMVMVQTGAMIVSVSICGFLIWRHVRAVQQPGAHEDTGRLVRQVWHFGMVQLASNVGLNAAGWWMASLIARSDATLVQMGVFAVANQLRNMAALAPGLLTQGSYGMIAQRADRESAPHERVMALCTLGSGFSSILIAGLAIAVLPWILPRFFGQSFRSGVLAGSLALATAIVHMAAGPVAARLTVVSLRMTGIVNGLWAVLVVALATVFVGGGGAAQATAIYLAAHLVSAVMVVVSLRGNERMPEGLIGLSVLVHGTAIALAMMAYARGMSSSFVVPGSLAILALVSLSLFAQLLIARRHGWIPAKLGWDSVRSLMLHKGMRLRRGTRRVDEDAF
jgi:O-antigen/teichoic acid export membrane protein